MPGVRFRIKRNVDAAVDPPAREDPDAPAEEAPQAQLPSLPPHGASDDIPDDSNPAPSAQDPDTVSTVILQELKTTLKELEVCAYPSRDFKMRPIWLHKMFRHATPSTKLKSLLIYGGVQAGRFTNIDEKPLAVQDMWRSHSSAEQATNARQIPVRPTLKIVRFQCDYVLITDRTFFYKQGTYVRDFTATEAVRACATVWIRWWRSKPTP